MSETAEAQVAAPQPVAQQEVLSEQGQQVATLLSLADKDPVFAAKPEIVALKQKAAEIQSKKNKTSANANVSAEDSTKPAGEETSEEEGKEGKEKKSVFRANKISSAIELNSVDDYNRVIKEKFGVEDPVKYFQTAEKWRNDSQQLSEVSDRATGLETILSEIPDPIYDAIQEWGKGGDWVSVLKNGVPKLDYNKPFDKQVNQIVEHYFPGRFSEDDLEDTSDPVVENAIEVAKTKFDLEKGKIDSKRAATLEKADATAKAIKASVASSVEKLEESFPEFDTRKRSEIKQILLSGDLNNLFYKKDGTFKPEAAKMLAMALYGEQEITGRVFKASTKAANQAETATLMNTIERGKGTPPATSSQGSAAGVLPEQIQKTLEGINKKTFY